MSLARRLCWLNSNSPVREICTCGFEALSTMHSSLCQGISIAIPLSVNTLSKRYWLFFVLSSAFQSDIQSSNAMDFSYRLFIVSSTRANAVRTIVFRYLHRCVVPLEGASSHRRVSLYAAAITVFFVVVVVTGVLHSSYSSFFMRIGLICLYSFI